VHRRIPIAVTQGQLFSLEPTYPEGFLYKPDFLSEGEQAEFLRCLQDVSFEALDYRGYTAKRRAVVFGLDYDFSRRRTSATKPFSDFMLPIRERAAVFAGLSPDELVEGMILEYSRGAPIGWHRDAPQFGIVIGVSLLNLARMRFKPHKRQGKIISVVLEPRSIYVLRGSVRWEWQHSIPAVDKLRYSITFRTLREREQRKMA
jgi:alkylated DNA repair dioxygenase AlkB